jgi:hypothetical protein
MSGGSGDLAGRVKSGAGLTARVGGCATRASSTGCVECGEVARTAGERPTAASGLVPERYSFSAADFGFRLSCSALTLAWTPGRRANLDPMITQAHRAAERRRASLEKIRRQVKDGSLTIRKMTAEERKRYPPIASKGRRK